MAQNPVPGLILPSPNDSSLPQSDQDNNNALLRWSKSVSPRMYTTASSDLTTTPPPAPPYDGYLEQVGIAGIVFASGNGSLVLPQPFPVAVLSCQLTPAISTAFTYILSWNQPAATNQTIPIACWDTFAGARVSGPVLVDYRTLGW